MVTDSAVVEIFKEIGNIRREKVDSELLKVYTNGTIIQQNRLASAYQVNKGLKVPRYLQDD